MSSTDVIVNFNTRQYCLSVTFKTACYLITFVSLAYHLGLFCTFIWYMIDGKDLIERLHWCALFIPSIPGCVATILLIIVLIKERKLSVHKVKPLRDCHIFLKLLSLHLNFSFICIIMEIVIAIVHIIEKHVEGTFLIVPSIRFYCWWTIQSFYFEELKKRKVGPSSVMDISL